MKNHLIIGLIVSFFVFFISLGCARHQGRAMTTSGSPAGNINKVQAFGQNHHESDRKDKRYDTDMDEFEEEFEHRIVHIADPLAPWNKLIFQFNDQLYFLVLKPLAKGYKAITPRRFRVGVKNFFYNLSTPVRTANCLLQGKLKAAGIELERFLINTTAGFAGFGDMAEISGRPKPGREDLGQTLGVYGIGNGCYVVWPFFGPSTLRDTFGLAGDGFLAPVSYVDPWETALGINGLKAINNTSFKLGDYEALIEASVMPYEAVRDAYIQFRLKKVKE